MSHRTVQDVTKEILYELDQIIFPFTPFEVKGSYCSQLRLADLIQDDILYLRDMVEWWLEDREDKQWEMKNDKISQQVLRTLKGINMDTIQLISFSDEEEVEEEDYTEMMISYIVKLGMMATTLSEWMKFLLKQEKLLLKSEEVHCSLGMFL
jgi:hypothetical protein